MASGLRRTYCDTATMENADMDAATASSPHPAQTVVHDRLDGVAWSYRFSKTGVAEPLQGPVLREALEKQETWLWLNFDLADDRAGAAIAARRSPRWIASACTAIAS